MENPSTQTYYDLHRGVSRLSNNQLLKFPVVLVIHIHWKMPLIPRALSLLMPVFYTRGLPGGAVGKEYTYCYARCPNPPAGKEKTSMTMQHAKQGKFIADSSQGPCCNQHSGAKSESRAPVSTHIYRVLNFKHKQWVVGASGLVTCLQSNFFWYKLSHVWDFPGDFLGGLLGAY